jgi:hypothetical protein
MRCKFVALHLELTGGCALLTTITTITSAMSTATAITTTTMPTTQMAWRSAPLLSDKVTL